MIPMMDSTATDLYKIEKEEFIHNIRIKICNLLKKSRIRGLGPDDIDKLISISGIVIRTSEIKPQIKMAVFMCTIYNKKEQSILNMEKIIEPILCNICHSKCLFELMHNMSSFDALKYIKI